jgi:serine/threonine protein kinase
MTSGAGTQFVTGNEWSNENKFFFFFLINRRYQAPEIVNEEKYCLNMYIYLLYIYIARYGKAADVYSLGIVLYILISGGRYEYKNSIKLVRINHV